VSEASGWEDEPLSRRARRRRRPPERSRGPRTLRGRAALAFTAVAIVLVTVLCLGVWFAVTGYLLVDRARSTLAQTTANAAQVQRALSQEGVRPAHLLSQLRRENGSTSLLYHDGTWITSSLQVGRKDLPSGLRRTVVSGTAASQRFFLDGHPVLAIGEPLTEGDDAYFEVFPTIRPGDTEREVHSRIVASCLRRGFGWVHGILNTSTNPILYGGEGDARFERGDLVRTDYVAYLDGYPGHQSRMAVVGRPTEAQRRGYALTRDVHRMTIDRCRPGVLASDVYTSVVEAFGKHGETYTASMVGHSVGPWFHQQEPILSIHRPVPLEDGMVLAIEPYRGSWHIQDMIVVRPSGPELISPKFSIDELFVIDV